MSLGWPRAILFDWDNTVVESWDVIHAALHDTFRALDMEPWTLDQTKAWVRRSMRDSFPQVFGDKAEEANRRFYESYRARHLHDLKLLPGAAETLEMLVQGGLYLGVVSSKNGAFVRSEAKHLALERYFAKLVGATDAEHDKPAPAAMELALKGSGIPTGADVWYVGDTGIDVVCARNAGCTAIVISASEPRDGDKSFKADQQFADHIAF